MIDFEQIYIPVMEHVFARRIFECIYVCDSAEGFEVILEDVDKNLISIKAKGPVAYRRIDEGDALRSFGELIRQDVRNFTLYRVEKSRFIKWLKTENSGILAFEEDIKHFCIFSRNDFIEFIDYEFPEVTKI